MALTDQDIQFAKDAITKTGLFSGVTAAELAMITDGMEKQSYQTGHTVLFQGEISNQLCLVQSGLVEVWARKGRDKVKVAELAVGAYFGEISLLTPRAATATIKAAADTDIIFLPGAVVEKIVKSNPMLCATLNAEIEKRLAARQQALDKDK